MDHPGIFSSLRLSGAGLTAQRIRMNAAAQNLANIDDTRGEAGGPYQRRRVVLEAVPFAQVLDAREAALTTSVEASVEKVLSQGRPVHDPSHPDADGDGMVWYPDMDLATEMLDLTSAARAYEANATALESAKAMALRALEI